MQKVRIGSCFTFGGLKKSLQLNLDIVIFDSFAQFEKGELTFTGKSIEVISKRVRRIGPRVIMTRCFAITPRGYRILKMIGGIKAKSNAYAQGNVKCFNFFISIDEVSDKIVEIELDD